MTLVIGLCGAEGAGKSTVARYLLHARDAKIVPFAAPLKRMLEGLGLPAASLYGTPEDKARPLDLLGGKSGRWAMQSLGTEWGRKLIHPDLWMNAWKLQVSHTSTPIVVADDLRFMNEAAAVRSFGGIVIRVRRSAVEKIDETLHPSARWWDIPTDAEVHNDGDVDHLERQVGRVLEVFESRIVDA